MPQSLLCTASQPTGATILDIELRAEQAASLGHAGSAVERALRTLKATPAGDAFRPGRVIAAAQAVHAYLIQFELTGINTRGNYDSIIAGFAIPSEVMAKVGVRA